MLEWYSVACGSLICESLIVSLIWVTHCVILPRNVGWGVARVPGAEVNLTYETVTLVN